MKKTFKDVDIKIVLFDKDVDVITASTETTQDDGLGDGTDEGD